MPETGKTEIKIAVIGLGYVGLPLAAAFSKRHDVVGYDINDQRIRDLRDGIDRTLEVTTEELKSAARLSFSSDKRAIKDAEFYIVTVPTPINQNKTPDLKPLKDASRLVGSVVGRGNHVVFESTVYPGLTEELCVPIIEQESGLVFNEDFYVGYSPERINPGDTEHKIFNVTKVTSGSTPEAARIIDELYASIIPAGTHLASSIRVAEAAKVIENIQRDVNIALVNELALLFNQLDIDTAEVLEAAGTKWNFLPFKPGLVGGHCIGVDPYYLATKATSIGFHTEIILAGRRVNDAVGAYVADELVRHMIARKIDVAKSQVLIMGLTFKENCPDTRNTHVIDIVNRLKSYDLNLEIYDPWIKENCEIVEESQLHLMTEVPVTQYDGIILAVSHQQFLEMTKADFDRLRKPTSVIYDVKSVLSREIADARF